MAIFPVQTTITLTTASLGKPSFEPKEFDILRFKGRLGGVTPGWYLIVLKKEEEKGAYTYNFKMLHVSRWWLFRIVQLKILHSTLQVKSH